MQQAVPTKIGTSFAEQGRQSVGILRLPTVTHGLFVCTLFVVPVTLPISLSSLLKWHWVYLYADSKRKPTGHKHVTPSVIIQVYWISELCPSSEILYNRRLGVSDQLLSSGVGRETPTLLGPLERSQFNQWIKVQDPIGRTLSVVLQSTFQRPIEHSQAPCVGHLNFTLVPRSWDSSVGTGVACWSTGVRCPAWNFQQSTASRPPLGPIEPSI
jgi:hypothetical protein